MSLFITLMLTVLVIGCNANRPNAAMPASTAGVENGHVRIDGLPSGTVSTILRATAPAVPTEPADSRVLSVTLVMTLPTSSTDASRTDATVLGTGMADRIYPPGTIELHFENESGVMKVVRSKLEIELRNDRPNVLKTSDFEVARM